METDLSSGFQIKKMIPYLLLNSSHIANMGLFHGKMGIVLFFAHYGRHTGKMLFDDFAGELLDEIHEDISVNAEIDLENGLCGIGWGIEYLICNGFMEGDSDEILEKIDRKIMERDPRRIEDLSFRSGLGGIIFYALARLTSPRKAKNLPFDKQYIDELYQAAQKNKFKEQDQLPEGLVETFIQTIDRTASESSPLALPSLLFVEMPDNTVPPETLPLGIEKGLTALCFSEISS